MGRRKALLIGINYTGSSHELQGCRQDVRNMVPFLVSRGFVADRRNMVVLCDDLHGWNSPTGHNILAAMDWLVSEPGCSLFLHYSGHGGQVRDRYGTREAGISDTIVPLDYKVNGQIDSDTLHRHLVSNLAPGCQLHVIFDCCHSGSAIELPYVYRSDEDGNVSMLDNVRQGVRLASAASHLLQGGFSFQQARDAQQLYAGAQSFFKSLRHEPTEPGLAEEDDFSGSWKYEHKRVVLFSGCRDDQTSADATIAGGHVGAMSWAFLETMRRNPNMSYLQVLQNTRWLMRQTRHSQVPQLSVGSQMDLNQVLYL